MIDILNMREEDEAANSAQGFRESKTQKGGEKEER